MKAPLTWAAALFALAAAVLWLKATIVRLEYRPVPDQHGMFDAAIVRKEGSRQIDVLETAERQTLWNMWAAVATAASAVCQAVSLLISS